jgi:hypothetical protein
MISRLMILIMRRRNFDRLPYRCRGTEVELLTCPTFCTRRNERLFHVCGPVECGWQCDGDGSWQTVSQGRVRSPCIVMDAPFFDDPLGFPEALEDLAVQQFAPELAVQGLAAAVLLGCARHDVKGLRAEPCQPMAQDLGDHFRTLSNLMKVGTPSKSMSSASVSMTPMALIRRAALIARHLRLNSSIRVISRIRRPAWVAASTKLKLQTWFGCSGRSGMQDPSLSQRRDLFGCFAIMRAGGWKSTQTVLGYLREAEHNVWTKK